jgi:UDP-N-acetylmuramyl pentapeptide phosphotransferase/UDP-N-acetylglucosamine-1-phosphate transferase
MLWLMGADSIPWLYLIVVPVLAFAAAALLSPLTIRLSRRRGLLDRPAGRRLHAVPTPRLGGIPLYFGLLAALLVTLPFSRSDPNELPKVIGLLIGMTIIVAVGAYDDLRELKPLPQFAFQFLAALAAILAGVVIDRLPGPLGGDIRLEWLAVPFTLFWIVGMMNTINFLDGLDGLASGVTVIAGAVLFAHTFELGQTSLTLLPLALIGGTLGFLIFNFPPARIFLGSGAYLLGFLLAVMSIIGGAKVATALLVLAIPILDVAWQILHRLLTGHSPFAADRGHLHHRLFDLGNSPRRILIIYYALTAAFGVLALVLPNPVYKLIALIVIGIGALAALIRLGKS